MWLWGARKEPKCRITLFLIFSNESLNILLRKRREKQNEKISLGYEKCDCIFKVQKTPKTHRPLLHNAPQMAWMMKNTPQYILLIIQNYKSIPVIIISICCWSSKEYIVESSGQYAGLLFMIPPESLPICLPTIQS